MLAVPLHNGRMAPVLEQRLRQHLLELCVLPLQVLQPPGLVHLHVPELLLPPVERRLRDVRLPADLLDRLEAILVPAHQRLARALGFAEGGEI